MVASAWIKKVLSALDDDVDKLDAILNENSGADKVEELNKLHDGTTVLHATLTTPESLKVLLKHGARPSIPDENGVEPLLVAVTEDYVESVLALCLHGADVNILSNEGKTLLQISALQATSSACFDSLQYFGATMPDDVVNSLLKNEITKQNYWSIHQGYKDKKIRNGRSTLTNTDKKMILRDSFGVSIGITIDKLQVTSHMFVCRMQLEYQSSFRRIPKVQIPDGAEQISDIFQYKVDTDFKCELYIDVKGSNVPIDKRYKELIVCQVLDCDDDSREEVYTDVQYVGDKRSQVLVKHFCFLASRSSPVIAFAVFVRSKKDSHQIESTGSLVSTQDSDFSLQSGPELVGSQVDMQVKRVDLNSDNNSDVDSGIGSHSDFCTISIRSSPETPSLPSNSRPQTAASVRSNRSTDSCLDARIIVTVPNPNSKNTSEDPSHVLTSQQGDDTNFEEHTDTVSTGKQIKCLNAKPGNFIVIVAKRITELIKAKVSAMWEAVNGSKRSCRLFATTKPLDGVGIYLKYLVTIHLCEDETDYLKKENKVDTENGKLQIHERYLKSYLDIEINIKSTYTYHLDIKNGTVEGGNKLPVQYQRGNDMTKVFSVLTEDSNKLTGLVKISKSVLSKTKKLPIEFLPNKVESITGNRFLNDEYIEKRLAETIGLKWFIFGIYTGSPFVRLEGYEDIEMGEACKKVLYNWRDAPYQNTGHKLDTFIRATIDAGIPQLREEFVKNHVVKYSNKSNKDIKEWLDQYKTNNGNGFEFTKLKSKAVSPLDDTFFVYVSKKMDLNAWRMTAIRMGLLQSSEVDEIIRGRNSADYYIKCKLLARLQDKAQGNKKTFLTTFLKCLKKDGNNLLIDEITASVKIWIDGGPDINCNGLRSINDVRAIFKKVQKTI